MARATSDESETRSRSHVRALDSKMSVLAQRLKIIEKNERILAKTVTRNNKRIKKLREKVEEVISKGVSGAGEVTVPSDRGEFQEGLKEIQESLDSLKETVESNQKSIRNFEDKVSELQYVVDTLNPVEYLSSTEIADMIDERIGESKKSEKKSKGSKKSKK